MREIRGTAKRSARERQRRTPRLSVDSRGVTDFSRPHVNSLRLRRDLSATGNIRPRTSFFATPRRRMLPVTVEFRINDNRLYSDLS